MKIHPLITKSDDLAALVARLSKPRLRRGRHRVHAREHLLAGPLPDPDREPEEAAAIDPKADGIDLDAAARPAGRQ